MVKASLLFASSLMAAFTQVAEGQIVIGSVIDETSKQALVYAQIGVTNSQLGAISDEKGNFKINLTQASNTDTVRISMMGYQPLSLSVSNFKQLAPTTFQLKIRPIELAEVRVKTSDRSRAYGSQAESKKITTGWRQASTGGERGIPVSVGKTPRQVLTACVCIANSQYDSLLLRVHIRQLVGSNVGYELLDKSIVTTTKLKSGWVEVDLTPYQLILADDVLLSFEWVKAWGSCRGTQCLTFSSRLLGPGLYSKEASQDRWSVTKGFTPGMYLVAQ